MEEAKGLLTSKTFWGVVITVGAALAKAKGYSIDEATAVQFADELVIVAGGLFAIYGRIKADKLITKL